MVSELEDSPPAASSNIPSTSTGNPPASTTPATTLFNPNQNSVGVKLDETNYLIWKQQVIFTVKGYSLESLIENPQYVLENPTMNRQDFLLSSWLLSSISSPLLPHFVGHETAGTLWAAINKFFSGKSKARILQLKNQLQTIKKTSMPMQEYLLRIKTLCDNLALCGKPVSEDDQVLFIVSGLGHEFEPIITTILSKDDQDIESIRSMLLTAENRITQQLHPHNNNSTMAANVVTTNKKPWETNSNSSSNLAPRRGGNRGRGRGGRWSSTQAFNRDLNSKVTLDSLRHNLRTRFLAKSVVETIIWQINVSTDLTLIMLHKDLIQVP